MKTRKIFLAFVVLFTTSISLFSQTAEEWKNRGNKELEEANYDKAIEYYQKAIETDSTYFAAYHNLGIAFSYKLDYDKAIEYYNKAIAIDNTQIDSYIALGGAYEQKQDYNKAIEIVKQGLIVSPNSSEAYYYLSILYDKIDAPTYVIFYAKRAAQLGDKLAQQFLAENEISWEYNFEKPDYKQIKSNIADKKSSFYYPKLWDRYQKGDSTLTLDEKRHLYYGYVFHKDYSPYASSYDQKQVNDILSKENPTEKEWEKLVALLNTALSSDPFSCRYLFYQYVAYKNLNQFDKADIAIKKLRNVADALSSTGDGLSKETAIHVISVSSEYDYLFLYDLSMNSQSLIDGGYDVLYLNPNKDGLEEMWFDVSQALIYLSKQFK